MENGGAGRKPCTLFHWGGFVGYFSRSESNAHLAEKHESNSPEILALVFWAPVLLIECWR
jgi:hypothetical protein